MDEYINGDPFVDADKRVVVDSSDDEIGYVNQNRLDALSKVLIRRQIQRDTLRISQIDDALAAFGKAHNTLAENFEKVGTKSDPEVVKKIFDDLKDILEGIDHIKKADESEESES